MKLQVAQTDKMAVPDGRGGWMNPVMDASPSPVTLFRYKTLEDAEFKSIVDYEENKQSPETLPYEKISAETTQKQVNGTPVRGKEFWWPKKQEAGDDEDDDGSTMKEGGSTMKDSSTMKDRRTGARPRGPTRHDRSVQRKERRLLKIELDQREREIAYKEEIHNMQMAALQAEKRAHDAKCRYYNAKLAAVNPVTNGGGNARRKTLP